VSGEEQVIGLDYNRKAEDLSASFPDPSPDCDLCPRLHNFIQEWRKKEPSWYNAPIKPFLPQGGLKFVRLLLAGLAPGLRGANRTGRPFTGDYAGVLLYETLKKYNFAEGEYRERPDDGLQLREAAIVNSVRCVPPQNKPLGAEINNCRRYLKPYLCDLPNVQVIVTLGKIAHESTLRAMGLRVADYPFAHGRIADIERPQSKGGALRLISSYHCSRYNTNTGRLTEKMFHDVFASARAYLDSRE